MYVDSPFLAIKGTSKSTVDLAKSVLRLWLMTYKAARSACVAMSICALGMFLYVPGAYAAVPTCLIDTSQADFLAGDGTGVDLNASPSDVILSSETVIDQKNEAGTTTGTGFGTQNWTGQTFVPEVTGALVGADVQLFCNGCGSNPPDLVISVRATSGTLPTGADLASAIIPGSIFENGASHVFTAIFTSPAALTSGTRYALILRVVSPPSGAGYFWLRSSPSTYAGGSRLFSADSGSSWTADTTRDYNFKTHMDAGYGAGNLVSSLKDAGAVTNWETLAWSSTVPIGTSLRFQAAARNDSAGPFDFVGPDGTSATYFETSDASLSQFNGNRYLKYKAYLDSADGTQTPVLNDVSACFEPQADLSITKTDAVSSVAAGGSLTYTVTASNSGPSGASGATVADVFPSILAGTWTCVGSGGGTCTAAGSGDIDDLVNLPAGSSVTYTVNATIAPNATGTLSNTATVSAPANVQDPDLGNNSATDTDSITPLTRSVGGNISGLDLGATVVLLNNGVDNLSLPANGAFAFSTALAYGSPYNVTVLSDPAGASCTVSQGSGIIGTSIVNDVSVQCVPNLAISTSEFGPLRVGQTVNLQLIATGGMGPYTWSATNLNQPLPAGLSLSVDGILSGQPTASGSYSTLVTVADASGVALFATLAKAGPSSVSQVFAGEVAPAPLTEPVPVPLFGEWWEKLLLALTLVGVAVFKRRRGDLPA